MESLLRARGRGVRLNEAFVLFNGNFSLKVIGLSKGFSCNGRIVVCRGGLRDYIGAGGCPSLSCWRDEGNLVVTCVFRSLL